MDKRSWLQYLLNALASWHLHLAHLTLLQDRCIGSNPHVLCGCDHLKRRHSDELRRLCHQRRAWTNELDVNVTLFIHNLCPYELYSNKDCTSIKHILVYNYLRPTGVTPVGLAPSW